jgi:hypothetical protein
VCGGSDQGAAGKGPEHFVIWTHAALAEVLDQPRDMALVVAVAEPLPITPVTRPLVQTSTRYPCHTKSGSNRSRPGPGAAREQSAPGPPGGGGEPGAPQLAN